MMIVVFALMVIRLFGRLLRAAWSDPVDPVSNTVITVAYAVANFLGQIRWLRTLTGGADPPGSNYFVRSTSVSGTTWDTGAAGIAAVQGFQSVNRTGDTMSGILTATGFQAGASGMNAGSGGINGGSGAGYQGGSSTAGIPSFLGAVVGASGVSIAGAGGIAVSGGGGISVTGGGGVSAGGAIASSAGLSGTTGAFSSVIQSTLANGTAPFILASSTKNTNLHADLLDGAHASATPTPSTIPITDSSGLLDAWISTSAGSWPSGMGGWWSGVAATIPAGFARATSLDGRVPVGAGTSFSTTFVEGASYGSSWSHNHPDSGHQHGASALGVSGNTGQPSASGGTVSGTPPPSFGTSTHTHDQGTLDVTGSTDAANANPATTAWVIPMFGVVWVVKT